MKLEINCDDVRRGEHTLHRGNISNAQVASGAVCWKDSQSISIGRRYCSAGSNQLLQRYEHLTDRNDPMTWIRIATPPTPEESHFPLSQTEKSVFFLPFDHGSLNKLWKTKDKWITKLMAVWLLWSPFFPLFLIIFIFGGMASLASFPADLSQT